MAIKSIATVILSAIASLLSPVRC